MDFFYIFRNGILRGIVLGLILFILGFSSLLPFLFILSSNSPKPQAPSPVEQPKEILFPVALPIAQLETFR